MRIKACEHPLRVQQITLTNDSGSVFTLTEPADAFVLQPGEEAHVEVAFQPEADSPYRGTLHIDHDDLNTPLTKIQLTGAGTLNQCPHPQVATPELQVMPLDIITLDGRLSNDPDGWIVESHWVVLDAPRGSTTQPLENYFNPARPQDGGRPDDPSTPGAFFWADLAGSYTLALNVVDEQGLQTPSHACPAPETHLVEVFAEPSDDILIQVTWNTPQDIDQTDDDGTDIDVHLLHPLGLHPRGEDWSQAPFDCYFANKEPDWGPEGPDGNPSLDIDDVNGAGPENISVNHPEDTTALGAPYLIGVHYYRAESFLAGDYGPSDVTVRIYLGGELSDEFQRQLLASDHFWRVGAIEWTPGNHRIMPIDRYYERIP
jgi:hypothetical protein